MYKLRFQSMAVIPGMIVRPFHYYPSNKCPRLFKTIKAAERVAQELPKGTEYEILSPFNAR